MMSKNARRWVIEIACILFCLLITVLLGSYFYKGGILSGTLMLHLFSAIGNRDRQMMPLIGEKRRRRKAGMDGGDGLGKAYCDGRAEMVFEGFHDKTIAPPGGRRK